ncbi:MAG TPA: sugar ABC transporter permease [Solirubrobacteraceae bacterium]|nr:sugar ABC transporter permease [Solirubrobacteraceae bacterium]
MEAATARLTGSGRRSKGIGERRLAQYMLAPSLLLIALVAAYPILYAIWLSLHDYSVVNPGLKRWDLGGNYADALQSSAFWAAFRTTFVFTLFSVVFETIIGLGMALAMHAAFRGQGVLRTVILVPWAVLTVVTAIMWRTMFEAPLGLVPSVLETVGIGQDIVWLGERPYALIVMIVADVWKTAPFMALLILAGLQVIPNELYEAAKVDGAKAWQRFTRITLPLLKPAILVALIFRTLDALRIFDLPFVLTKGAQGTNTLSLLAYQELQQNQIIGLGSALSVLTFVIVMAVSLLYIRFVGGNIKALTED